MNIYKPLSANCCRNLCTDALLILSVIDKHKHAYVSHKKGVVSLVAVATPYKNWTAERFVGDDLFVEWI